MPLVIDSSVALSWCFDDEKNAIADDLLVRLSTGVDVAIVPALWLVEITNSLKVGERRSRIGREHAHGFLRDLDELPVHTELVSVSGMSRTLEIAHEHDLSAYDAVYLELAMRRSLPLATLDKKLAKAATDAGMEVVG